MPLVASSMREFVLAFNRPLLGLALALGMGLTGSGAAGAASSPPSAPATPDWSGTWYGRLDNFPQRPNVPEITVRREIGAWPQKGGDCAEFKTFYFEKDVEKGRKEYRLCRRSGDHDYSIDEGGGVELDARLLDQSLVSTFKYGSILLISVLRVRGKIMEEEIYTAADQPATAAVLSLNTRSLQRLTLRKGKRR